MSAQPKSAISPAASALAPIRPARTIEDLARAYSEAQERGHLLSPLAVVDDIPAMHKVALHATVIDPTILKGRTTGPEVYFDARYCDKEADEVALGATALAKIMRTAGAKIVGSPKRVDSRRDPYYWEVQVTLGIRELDGSWSEVTKAGIVDLRDGAPETMKPEWKEVNGRNTKTGKLVPLEPSALADKRRNIGGLAETKGLNRCIRHILHLRRTYTREELLKPFWVPVLVQDLDPKQPDERALLLAQMGHNSGVLYGQPATGTAAQASHEDDAIDVSAMVEEPDAAPASPAPPAGPADSAAEEAASPSNLLTGVKIEAVSEKRGPDGEDGKPKWTRYGVKVGEEWFSTFSDSMAATARAAKAQGATVTVEYAVDEKGYRNLTAITPGVQRDLPLTPLAAVPAAADADPWPAEDAVSLDACPLPLSDAQVFSVPANQENRVKALGMINTAFGQLVAARGEREARAIGAKVAGGLDPVATPMPELRAVWEALRAELGGGR